MPVLRSSNNNNSNVSTNVSANNLLGKRRRSSLQLSLLSSSQKSRLGFTNRYTNVHHNLYHAGQFRRPSQSQSQRDQNQTFTFAPNVTPGTYVPPAASSSSTTPERELDPNGTDGDDNDNDNDIVDGYALPDCDQDPSSSQWQDVGDESASNDMITGSGNNTGKQPKPYSNTTHPPSTSRRKPPPHKRPSMGYIPRPPNAFMLFRADFVRQKHIPGSSTSPNLDIDGQGLGSENASLSKIIGQVWRGLSDADRKVWEQRAKEKKKEHKERYPEYRFRPVHDKEKRRKREEAKMEKERERQRAVMASSGPIVDANGAELVTVGDEHLYNVEEQMQLLAEQQHHIDPTQLAMALDQSQAAARGRANQRKIQQQPVFPNPAGPVYVHRRSSSLPPLPSHSLHTPQMGGSTVYGGGNNLNLNMGAFSGAHGFPYPNANGNYGVNPSLFNSDPNATGFNPAYGYTGTNAGPNGSNFNFGADQAQAGGNYTSVAHDQQAQHTFYPPTSYLSQNSNENGPSHNGMETENFNNGDGNGNSARRKSEGRYISPISIPTLPPLLPMATPQQSDSDQIGAYSAQGAFVNPFANANTNAYMGGNVTNAGNNNGNMSLGLLRRPSSAQAIMLGFDAHYANTYAHADSGFTGYPSNAGQFGMNMNGMGAFANGTNYSGMPMSMGLPLGMHNTNSNDFMPVNSNMQMNVDMGHDMNGGMNLFNPNFSFSPSAPTSAISATTSATTTTSPAYSLFSNTTSLQSANTSTTRSPSLSPLGREVDGSGTAEDPPSLPECDTSLLNPAFRLGGCGIEEDTAGMIGAHPNEEVCAVNVKRAEDENFADMEERTERGSFNFSSFLNTLPTSSSSTSPMHSAQSVVLASSALIGTHNGASVSPLSPYEGISPHDPIPVTNSESTSINVSPPIGYANSLNMAGYGQSSELALAAPKPTRPVELSRFDSEASSVQSYGLHTLSSTSSTTASADVSPARSELSATDSFGSNGEGTGDADNEAAHRASALAQYEMGLAAYKIGGGENRNTANALPSHLQTLQSSGLRGPALSISIPPDVGMGMELELERVVYEYEYDMGVSQSGETTTLNSTQMNEDVTMERRMGMSMGLGLGVSTRSHSRDSHLSHSTLEAGQNFAYAGYDSVGNVKQPSFDMSEYIQVQQNVVATTAF